MKKCVSSVLLVVLCFLISPVPAAMAAWEEYSTPILGSGSGLTSSFGSAVDVDGSQIIVGARAEASTGIAYVFTESGGTWTEEEKLSPPAGVSGDFGLSVAIDGDHAIVGAPGDTVGSFGNAGSIHFYERSGGTWGAPILSIENSAGSNEYFGDHVRISGDNAVVTRRGGDTIHFYEYSGGTWTEDSTVTIGSGSWFGFAADIEGNLAVSCDQFWGNWVRTYEYTGGTWVARGAFQLTARCEALTIYGDYVIVGDPFYDEGPGVSNSGRVRVMKTSDGGVTWDNPGGSPFYIHNPTPFANDYFGEIIEMNGTNILIGAEEDETRGVASGRAYLYTGADDSWSLEAELFSTETDGSDHFSFRSVAIDGDVAFVGAPNAGSSSTGAAYVFGAPAAAGGGSVPEFRDYILMITIVIAAGFMIKIAPRMKSGMRAA